MENQTCIFLGIKVKPGPIERHKLENYALDNTVDSLKTEAEKKANVPSTSLELIHHGKILKDDHTLHDSGVKNGEMVHVVVKKVQAPPAPPPTFTDNDLQLLNTSLRTLGCTPNAPGWTRAMQLLNDDSAMSEIIEQAPSIGEDCVALSILHEVELLAALGANIHTMRRGANAHPELPAALRHLTRLVRSRNSTSSTDSVPTSGFAYSLEALSEDEDADEEETEETERNPITQEQFTAALQAATDAISSSSRGSTGSQDSLLRLLQSSGESSRTLPAVPPTGTDTAPPINMGSVPNVITPEMFREAIAGAFLRPARRNPEGSVEPNNTATQELARIAADIAERERLTLLAEESIARRRAEQRSYPATQELARIAADIAERERLTLLAEESIARRRAEQRNSENQPRPNLTPEVNRNEATQELARIAADIAERERLTLLAEESIARRRAEQRSSENQPRPNLTPEVNRNEASSSQSPAARENSEDFSTQLQFMHEMGLLEDTLNVRALIICAGDVNAAINLVFSGAIGDE